MERILKELVANLTISALKNYKKMHLSELNKNKYMILGDKLIFDKDKKQYYVVYPDLKNVSEYVYLFPLPNIYF